MDIGRVPGRRSTRRPKPSESAGATDRGQIDPGASPVGSLKQLSEAAEVARRELLVSDRQSSDGSSSSTAQPLISRRAKMEEARRKIAEGYYFRPEIRQQIVDRLADNLNP